MTIDLVLQLYCYGVITLLPLHSKREQQLCYKLQGDHKGNIFLTFQLNYAFHCQLSQSSFEFEGK